MSIRKPTFKKNDVWSEIGFFLGRRIFVEKYFDHPNFQEQTQAPQTGRKSRLFLWKKKSLTGKYLLNLGQAQAMFGKCAPETHFSEFYFCPA